jgi:cellobiose-specific phosphotransferase system component IIC
MNEFWFLAFVVTPAVVVVIAYIAVRLHERSLKR